MTLEEMNAKYGKPAATFNKTEVDTSDLESAWEPTLSEKIGETFSETKEGIKDVSSRFLKGETGGASALLQAGGKVAKGVVETTGDIISSTPIVKDVVEKVSKPVATGIKATQDWLEKNPTFKSVVTSDVADSIASMLDKHPDIARNAEAINDIANAILIAKGGVQAAGTAKGAIESVVEKTPKVAKKITTTVSEGVSPKPTPEQAAKQVIQGKPEDYKSFQKALSAIDVSDVKTYADLKTKFDDIITPLSKKVDAELAKDPTVRPIAHYTTKHETAGGSVVEINYIKNALQDLSELYKTTGDIVKQTEVDDLLKQGENLALDRLTINNIARRYNVEFGEKAFNKKTGDPLTSVNAQKFENTRKGLKDVARQGLGGEEAKKIDELLTATYDSQKLITRMEDAVNKLQQRIEERGWVSKASYGLIKGIDVLSGGLIRGATDALLNRGTGLKTLNALDLQKNLSRNLEIITKALKAEKEGDFIRILKQLPENKSGK